MAAAGSVPRVSLPCSGQPQYVLGRAMVGMPESNWEHTRLLLNFSTGTPYFLFILSVRANHMAEPTVKKWAVPPPAVGDTTKVHRNREGWGMGPLMEFIRDVSITQSFFDLPLPVGFSSSIGLAG